MKANGIYAAHNIVEAKTNHGWAVLDPLFDIYFVKPDHTLASFTDVQADWPYYRQQLPNGYDSNYRYAGVRYTNWTKIPVIFPTVKKILDLTIGKPDADTISLRTYFLRKYDICFDVTLVLLVLVFFFTLVKLIKAKVFPQKNIPFTFSNILKYLRLRIFEKECLNRVRPEREVSHISTFVRDWCISFPHTSSTLFIFDFLNVWMLKVGVFGTGHLGKFHLNNWKEIQDAEIVGFYDPDPRTAAEVLEKYKIKRFTMRPH